MNLKRYLIVWVIILCCFSLHAQKKYSDFRNVPPELYVLHTLDSTAQKLSADLHDAFWYIEKAKFDSASIVRKSIGNEYKIVLQTDSLAMSHYLALRGRIAFCQSKYDSATYYYRKSIEYMGSNYSKNVYANRYVLLAENYNYLSRPVQAIDAIDTAIALYRNTLADTINLVKSYLLKCRALYYQKDYNNIIQLTDKSEILLTQIGITEHPLYMWLYYYRGFVQLDYGNRAETYNLFRKALAISEKYYEANHHYHAMMHNVCGIASKDSEIEGEELHHHYEALKIRTKVYGANAYRTSISLLNLGNYYVFTHQNFDSALYYYKKVNAIRKRVLGEKHQKTHNSYLKLNYVYALQKDWEKALESAHKAVISAHPTFNDTNCFALPIIGNKKYIYHFKSALHTKAYALLTIAKETNERKYYEKTIETCVKIDSVLLNERYSSVGINHNSFVLFHRNNYFTPTYFAAYSLYTKFDDKKALDYAFNFIERNKANNLFEKSNMLNLQNDKDIIFLKKYQTEKFRLEKELMNVSEKENLILKKKIVDYTDSIENITFRLKSKYSDSHLFSYDMPLITIKQVQDKLPPKTAIIEYCSLEANSSNSIYIIYIDNKNVKFIYKKCENLSININKLLLLVRNPEIESRNDMQMLGQELFNCLITDEKQKSIIGEHIENLVLIPQGELWELPFELCITKKTKTKSYSNIPYLVREYNISYTPSVNYYFCKKANTSNTKRKVLAIAPVFENKNTNQPTRSVFNFLTENNKVEQNLRGSIFRDDRISALPYSDNEVNNIAKLYDNTLLLTKKNATKQKLISLNLSDFDIVHIASHAVSNRTNPNFSGIILAANDTLSDNVLFGGELISFKMNPDLLVLSACETATGEIVLGEGVNSLSRTFGSIGANNVIASLWKVPDKETWLLMKYFYSYNVKDKENNYIENLRKAKLKMIENPFTAHPIYWSAFTITEY